MVIVMTSLALTSLNAVTTQAHPMSVAGSGKMATSPDLDAFRRRFDEIEALTDNCDKCRDVTSQRKCAELMPVGRSCDHPGYNYLKIFCRRTCNACQPCDGDHHGQQRDRNRKPAPPAVRIGIGNYVISERQISDSMLV